jgi:beta-glucosidase
MAGVWPPRIAGDAAAFARVTDAFVSAHRAGAAALRSGPGTFPVGLTLALPDAIIHPDGDYYGQGMRLGDMPTDGPLAAMARLMAGAYLEAARDDDFIGIQTYAETHLGPDGLPLPIPLGERMTQMAWTFSPEALGNTVRYAAAVTGVPVIVTENGVASEDDAERVEYVSRALAALRGAMDDAVDVRGYFYWSLLDNFEWAEGYRPKFGLVACDRETFVRTPKPSAAWYAAVVAQSRS